MPAGLLNLDIEQGATFSRTITVTDAAGDEIDVSDWEFSGQIRRRHDAEEVLAAFTFEIQNQVTNKGEVKITIPASETSAIPAEASVDFRRNPSRYVYDIEADTGTETLRLLEGNAIVSPEVTRA